MLIRFQPESRASSDQDPGPSSASAMMRTQRKMLRLASHRCEYTPNSSKATAVMHVIRVRKPNKRSIASKIATKRAVIGSRRPLTNACKELKLKALAIAARRSNSPMLGRASAKLGYRGRTTPELIGVIRQPETLKGILSDHFVSFRAR